MIDKAIKRRTVLVGATASALTVPKFFVNGARAAESIVVRDPGGPWTPAATEGYYKPFTKATGIEVVPVAAAHDPISQVKAMVDTKTYIWDAVNLSISVQDLLAQQGYLEEVDLNSPDVSELMPRASTKYWVGVDVYATVFGYREDKFKSPPQSWKDLWNVVQFPGSRCLRKYPVDSFEIALLADGVPGDQLYPLDMERALNKLDGIKKDVAVWWTGGAQASQLLKTAEVDICATWNGRIQAAIDDGAPVKIVWDQGLYAIEGFAIPKGNPKADLARKFVKFCANGERQAEFAKHMSYGPTNPNAYKMISKERAELLPTAPSHLPQMIYQDHTYWGQNQEKAIERFDAWLLA
jgi:putative spermidine/putrescine transport system substrate-binding protein